jgi:hypothetical protein
MIDKHLKEQANLFVKSKLLDEVVSLLTIKLYKRFDSYLLRDTDEIMMIKAQLEGLKSIKKMIEDLASEKL